MIVISCKTEELCPNTKIRIPEEHDENVPEDSLLQNEYNYTEITETLRDQFDELRRCAMKSTNISPSQTSDLQGLAFVYFKLKCCLKPLVGMEITMLLHYLTHVDVIMITKLFSFSVFSFQGPFL